VFWRAFQIVSFAIVITVAATLFCCPSTGREIGSFEGTWEGKLKVVAIDLNYGDSALNRLGRGNFDAFNLDVRILLVR
jgi:hypothetical protein